MSSFEKNKKKYSKTSAAIFTQPTNPALTYNYKYRKKKKKKISTQNINNFQSESNYT